MAAGDAFTLAQHNRIEHARIAAQDQTGLTFSVYVGPVAGGPHEHSRRLLSEIAAPGEERVLIYVAPAARVVEVVTTPAAAGRLSDQACALTVLSMATSFGVGDLVGGIVVALQMLADATSKVSIDA